jgi:uncharacterized protein (DUF934 family)
MTRLISQGSVVADRWALLRDAAALADLPDGAPAIVPLALWLRHRAALIARGEVGVLLGPADEPGAIAPDLGWIPVVAVDFPQFTDGRGYSHARLLRERHGYVGELRAVGDVARDQLGHLAQVGFDSFALSAGKDPDAALMGLADFSDGYQSTCRRTPWFRRRAASAAPANAVPASTVPPPCA